MHNNTNKQIRMLSANPTNVKRLSIIIIPLTQGFLLLYVGPPRVKPFFPEPD